MNNKNVFFAGTLFLLLIENTICTDDVKLKVTLPIQKPKASALQFPIYISQTPVNTAAIYPYYYHYPYIYHPHTGVVYQTARPSVQLPNYGWSNSPGYTPSIYTTPPPNDTSEGNVGDPNNPKLDVEFI